MSHSKIVILASGNGSNAEALIRRVQRGDLEARVLSVITDEPAAYVLTRAKNCKIPSFILPFKNYKKREDFNIALLNLLDELGPDWILLAGFMKILDPVLVRKYKGRILNIHPSLLPKYPGLRSIQRALEAGEVEFGVTIHFVDEGVDTGPILLQDSIQIEDTKDLDEITSRVHSLEHILYPKALEILCKGEYKKG